MLRLSTILPQILHTVGCSLGNLVSMLPLSCGVMLACMASSGCIHPNIPSVRYGTAQGDVPAELCEQAPPRSFNLIASMQERGHFQPLEENIEEEERGKPEVPWPRFHPLPTRPVLGSP